MTSCKKLCLPICIGTLLGFGLFAPKLMAQNAANTSSGPESPAPSDEGWHLGLTPYLWFAGVHGTSGLLGHEASIHADVSDVLSNFNIGFMGGSELRYNHLLFPVDFMWIKLTDNKALPINESASSLKMVYKQAIFAPRIGYRIVDREKIKVEWQMGIRYWHLNSSISLQASRLVRAFRVRPIGWMGFPAGRSLPLSLGRCSPPSVVMRAVARRGRTTRCTACLVFA